MQSTMPSPNPFESEWHDCLRAHFNVIVEEGDVDHIESFKKILQVIGEQYVSFNPIYPWTVFRYQSFRRVETVLYGPDDYHKYLNPVVEAVREPEKQPVKIAVERIKKVPAPAIIHPDGYELVHVVNSMIIHYGLIGKKTTLCKKKIDRPVAQADKYDTMFSVCEKCKSLT